MSGVVQTQLLEPGTSCFVVVVVCLSFFHVNHAKFFPSPFQLSPSLRASIAFLVSDSLTVLGEKAFLFTLCTVVACRS